MELGVALIDIGAIPGNQSLDHDLDAVLRLAGRVSVLVYGRVLTSGTPDAIRNNAEVQAVYLGTETLETPE